MKRTIYILLAVILAASCSSRDKSGLTYGAAPIYPDYIGVTVPVNIAPLNFDYTVPADNAETVFSVGATEVRFKGPRVRWSASTWRKLLSEAAGGDITVRSTAMDSTWTIHVSADRIPSSIAYRLLEPGYETYSKMGIYERELGSFRERPVIENTDVSGCINCHSFNRCEPDDLSIHVRGDHGATLLRVGGKMGAYNTKTDSTLGFCVYPYWHPTGDYIAYSTNSTRQLFHLHPDKLIEVFDMDSDLLIYDVREGSLSQALPDSTKGVWETFPTFAPDGKALYYCAAEPREIPYDLTDVRYNLYKLDFDPATGKPGSEPELLVDAASHGKSISFPRPSYDGKYVMYTLSDYGQFSIWHHEADLWMLDLATGETRALDEINSDDVESFHNWSPDSRWVVFSSRRDDGLFTRLYFAHVSADGSVGKPFMLPQKDPLHDNGTLFMSYNVPDFTTGPLKLDHIKARKLLNSEKRIPFTFKRDD